MWIEDFREEHGLERDEFARRVRILGARKRRDRPIGCSETLVYILERRKNAITHPAIANLIAEACGATAEQRDSIVAKKYRGEWSGDGVAKALFLQRRPKPSAPKPRLLGPNPVNGREIVMIDIGGNVIGRYGSIGQAALNNSVSYGYVEERVHRRIRLEFRPRDISFRFADEWDGLDEFDRRLDLARVQRVEGKKI